VTDPIFGPGFQGLSQQKRLEKTAKELEAVVVSQVFAAMRKTVPDSGLFEKSEADDIFRTMLDDQLARVVADQGPFGLAKSVTKELSAKVAKDGAAPASPTSPPASALAAGLAAHVTGARTAPAPHLVPAVVPPKSGWRG
jgi:flagellar protein FlgJ